MRSSSTALLAWCLVSHHPHELNLSPSAHSISLSSLRIEHIPYMLVNFLSQTPPFMPSSVSRLWTLLRSSPEKDSLGLDLSIWHHIFWLSVSKNDSPHCGSKMLWESRRPSTAGRGMVRSRIFSVNLSNTSWKSFWFCHTLLWTLDGTRGTSCGGKMVFHSSLVRTIAWPSLFRSGGLSSKSSWHLHGLVLSSLQASSYADFLEVLNREGRSTR